MPAPIIPPFAYPAASAKANNVAKKPSRNQLCFLRRGLIMMMRDTVIGRAFRLSQQFAHTPFCRQLILTGQHDAAVTLIAKTV
jgi:hypothetical protein